MITIRLKRIGRRNVPDYRLVVAEKARPVKGKTLEIVGHYLPARMPPIFERKDDRIQHWISKGAIPSDTVARLLRRAGLQNMDRFIEPYTKRKPREEVAASPPHAAAPASAVPSENTPAGESALPAA